jgi:membrane-bound lytic murein transglycosylase B
MMPADSPRNTTENRHRTGPGTSILPRPIRAGLYGFLFAFVLTACAATPQPAAKAAAPDAQSISTGPAAPDAVAQPLPDFKAFHETACPGSASNYGEWVARFQSYALAQGRPEPVIRLAFAEVRENDSISAQAEKQPEFVTPVWTYLERAVSAERVAKGQAQLATHKALLAEIAREYGVDGAALMGIWGIETDFGGNFGDVNVFEALSNLGYSTQRKDFACRELLAALTIAGRGAVKPSAMIGSWAGAMGHSQFLPTNYLSRGVDRDGTGAPDLWHSMPDVFASTANLLRHDGWRANLPWGLEVKLPADFPYELAELDIEKPIGEWRALGIKPADGTALPNVSGGTSILLLAGWQGPAFLITDNFRAILKYNYSTSYALAVAYLGQRVMGGQGVKAAWPRSEEPLSRDERLELQRLLDQRGYELGNADGVIGLKTRKAVRRFQREIGWKPDGFVTKALLAELRRRSAG